jgi:RNA polymerase sigma-70 factor (ECF subfamily)
VVTAARYDLVGVSPALVTPDFATIYRAHVDPLWRFLERLGVPPRHLEDATQDTFVIAHRQLNAFRGDSSLNTWLHGIALKVAKDYRRTDQRKGSWEALSDTTVDPGTAPDEATARRQELELVLSLLEQLDETHRTVFVLVEFEGLTSPEVAALTETNVNTVSTRLRAARLRFNELVQAMGDLR